MLKTIGDLSSQQVDGLRAGDKVALTTQLLLIAPRPNCGPHPFDISLSTLVEARVCCLVTDRAQGGAEREWRIAPIDLPAIDRLACAVLAAGARACVGQGPCSAALSYALRKYQGLYFAVNADWLRQIVGLHAMVALDASTGPIRCLPVDVRQIALTVAHDCQGRDLDNPGWS
jgi:hypothetical protein